MSEKLNKDIAEILSEHITNYKEAHPNLSGQQIAKKWGISSSSLNRIENGDVKTPTLDQVVKVLEGVGSKAEILGYLKQFYPIINSTFKDFYTTSEGINAGEKVRKYCQMKEYCLIILFAMVGNGTDEPSIKEVFGEVGVSRLNTLIAEGIISKDMNGVIGSNEDRINVASDTLSKISNIVIDECFKLEEIDQGLNYISFRAAAIDREKVMPLVISKLEVVQNEINEILYDEKNSGEDRIFYSICADSLIPKK